MPETSAGILLHHNTSAGREVFLVHPGGPFWSRKDEAAWSIPKGLVDPGEQLEAAARREFGEEVGTVPPGPLTSLGTFRVSSSKLLHVFTLEGEFDPQAFVSNSFEMEWPPRSGQKQSFPEVDRAAWFGFEAAQVRLHLGQRQLIEALRRHLSS
jgi:predicted NUDIX family NTP pyrophosphohydrolase